MNLSFLKQSLVILLVIISTASLKSQNNSEKDSSKCKLKLNLGTDIMSRYIWRGADYGNAPSIQPTLAVSMGNFEVGCWSAISLTNYYKEVDLYAKYTFKSLSLIITDYYVPSVNGTSNAAPDIRYFVYDDKKTAHSIEASLMYKGSEKFPLWLLGGVYVYGNDKRWGYDIKKDTTEATYYSSYLEAGYTFKFKENTADLFVGFTPTYGAYGNEMGIVNVGITGYRKIKITNDFELPLKGSLIFNPQTSNVFFALGITL
ncbi:MAG: hypothetical protein HXX09_03085 [Bacteroidetes bacterium]|nr:hypothetical protein [Bacteroidota bacterium]